LTSTTYRNIAAICELEKGALELVSVVGELWI
jgi:hypothetical protein